MSMSDGTLRGSSAPRVNSVPSLNVIVDTRLNLIPLLFRIVNPRVSSVPNDVVLRTAQSTV